MASIDLIVPVRGKKIHVFPIFTQIRPLARPRLNKHKNGVYQPKDGQNRLLDAMKYFKKTMIDQPCIIDIYINLTRKVCDISPYPIRPQYGDEDNLRKAINDALQIEKDIQKITKKIIYDDRFIVGGEQFKLFHKENGGVIRIYDIENADPI